MKTLLVSALLALTGGFASIAVANPPTDSDSSHPGTFVRDSIITTKVKTKLAAKHLSTLTNIQVDTDNAGMVWLSGWAPTKDASDLAEMIAKDTEGERGAHNTIG